MTSLRIKSVCVMLKSIRLFSGCQFAWGIRIQVWRFNLCGFKVCWICSVLDTAFCVLFCHVLG